MFFYILFAIPPLILGLAAQAWVNRAFADGSKVRAVSGLTGAQVSRRMLDIGGLQAIGVEGISGRLTDHYDPRTKTMRLSQPVGGSDSVAAVAVAAHETGHAFQHSRGEAGFRLRGSLVPATGFASQAWFPIFLIGIFMHATSLALLGVFLFAAIVLFQLVTLPVEFGASRKAMAMLTSQGVISQAQVPVARRVLTAAALTYVVGALVAIWQLALLFMQSRR
ncbi:MAG TPA: zinc metallopeptidase [Gaiellales bacterium]|jgi:Zn-dependent membrane protease YugP|nr:zinc metallopeptidase [Gaiellales bacterium]